MLLLPFFHVYSVNLLIFHQFVLYSSILMTILTKKHPHTRFSAPFQGVNDHDVYLAIKKKEKKTLMTCVFMKPFSIQLSIVHFPKTLRKAPPTSTFVAFLHCLNFFTLFELFVLSKHDNE